MLAGLLAADYKHVLPKLEHVTLTCGRRGVGLPVADDEVDCGSTSLPVGALIARDGAGDRCRLMAANHPSQNAVRVEAAC